ncbi:MAG TPA: PEP-CTERM sorting domain-containing protein [Tepidisphaeraceae bacterium]|nr:PEP-CTERM sorting domain-containing protein [Tepidisphaeraceae bacterium]
MKHHMGLLGGVAAGSIVLILASATARADNYVYGASSGISQVPTTTPPTSGNYLILTTAGGTEFAPMASYPTALGANGDSGWFSSGAESGPGNDAYITGNVSSVNGGHLRSFLGFNTTGLLAGVTSAALVVNTYQVVTTGTENVDFLGGINLVNGGTAATSETAANYVLSTEQNVSPAPSDITNIYTALGNGPIYGTFGYTAADDNAYETIPLTPSFISDINSALGNGQGLFVIGEDDTTVPEPASLSILMLGGTALLGRRRRSQLI